MNDQKTQNRAQRIHPQHLVEFLDGNGVIPDCPVCKNKTSSIHIENAEAVSQVSYHFAQIKNGELQPGFNSAFLAALLVCDRCGYLRTFASSVINKWLENKYPERNRDE